MGSMTVSPDDAERMMSELESWWLHRVQNEIAATVPKAIEYGANSMIEVGRSMLRIAGRSEVSDEEAIEVAVLFYVNGKIGRWIDAVAAGKRVSDDTIFDIGIYIKMAQRNRDAGSWPGVKEPDEIKPKRWPTPVVVDALVGSVSMASELPPQTNLAPETCHACGAAPQQRHLITCPELMVRKGPPDANGN